MRILYEIDQKIIGNGNYVVLRFTVNNFFEIPKVEPLLELTLLNFSTEALVDWSVAVGVTRVLKVCFSRSK